MKGLVDFFEAVHLNVGKITHRVLGKARHSTFKSLTDGIRPYFLTLGTERSFGHNLCNLV